MTAKLKKALTTPTTFMAALLMATSLQACRSDSQPPLESTVGAIQDTGSGSPQTTATPTPTPSASPSPAPVATPSPTPTATSGDPVSVSPASATIPRVGEEIFSIDFENLPDSWVGQAIDEEMAQSIFIEPYNLHEDSFARNGSRNLGFGGKCSNGKDVVFLDQQAGHGKMMCVRHCAQEKIEENFLHMHWQRDADPSDETVVAEYDFIVPQCMGTDRNCTAEWGGKLPGLGHGWAGGGKGDECGINTVGWKKGYPGGSESAFHGMSYRMMWRNPKMIDGNFRNDSYTGRNEACTVKNGHDAGDLLNLEMYLYYWKAKYLQAGGREGSETSLCNLPKAGDWTRLTMSVDPVNNRFQAWVNGKLAGQHTAPQTQSCGGVTKDPVQGVSGFFMGNFFGGATPTGQWATPEQVMCFDNIKVYKSY